MNPPRAVARHLALDCPGDLPDQSAPLHQVSHKVHFWQIA
jgi:hypothetical protein